MPNVSAAALRAGITLRPPKSRFRGEPWRRDTESGKANPQVVTFAQLAERMTPEQRTKLEQAGFVRAFLSQWTRPVVSTNGGVNAEAIGVLFRDPQGAREGAALLRSFYRDQAGNSNTPDVTEIAALRLGGGGWGFHLTGGDEAYEYGFALRNVVVDVYMLCWDDDCAPAQHVRQALQRYARAIAERATR